MEQRERERERETSFIGNEAPTPIHLTNHNFFLSNEVRIECSIEVMIRQYENGNCGPR